MSNAQLIHIFDNSTCLTKKQMRDYVGGKMTNEEAHAVEVHLNSCPLCNDAVEGLFEQQEAGLATMHELNTDFLKDHFGLSNPQVHLNSMAATQSVRKHVPREKKPAKTTILSWRSTSLAAGLLLLAGLIWFYRVDHRAPEPIAKVTDNLSKQSPEIAGKPGEPVAGKAIAMNEPKAEKRSVVQAITEPASKRMVDIAPDAVNTSAQVANISADTAGKSLKELTVTAYKVPLIGEDERRVIQSEDIEKMPTRDAPKAAATSAGVYQPSYGNSYDYSTSNKADQIKIAGARSSKTAYTVDGVQVKSSDSKISKKVATEPDKLQAADQLYSQKSYGDALNVYTKEMHAADADRKQAAMLGAARCYLALGNNAQAKKLLQNLVDSSNGSVRRHARRLLREIGE